MKKIIKMGNAKFLILVLVTTIAISCKKSQDLVIQDNYLGREVNGTSKLDSSLYDLMVKPYNIEVKYKWDQSLFDQQYVLVPPQINKILPYVELVKKLWIDPYNAETGSEAFMKTYAPKQLILAGSPMMNKDGTQLNGLAEGGLDILLANVNGTNVKDPTTIRNILHLIHHEFTHILNQKKVYPSEYKKITPSDYSASWAADNVEPLKLGFISRYARKDPDEDIAEMVAWMLTLGKDQYEHAYLNWYSIPDPALYPISATILITDVKDVYNRNVYILSSNLSRLQSLYREKNEVEMSKLFLKERVPTAAYADGVAKLRKKEALIVAYFKNAYNIDFYSLQANVQKAMNNALK